MCIALFSTAHPKYALIVAANRDEYLHRPTARASWWAAPHGHVLGGRDLEAESRGTWLGVTSDGRLATLTNYREDGVAPQRGAVSRGTMVNAYLTPPVVVGGDKEDEDDNEDHQEVGVVRDTESFARGLVTGEGARGSGGFSLVCGRPLDGRDAKGMLAVVSNRMADLTEVAWIGGGGSGSDGDGKDGDWKEEKNKKSKTLGLSNTAFGDRTWPKVLRGEELMDEIVAENAAAFAAAADAAAAAAAEGDEGSPSSLAAATAVEEQLVDRLIAMLSIDTLPPKREDEDLVAYIRQLRHSIFVPVLAGFDPKHGGNPDAPRSPDNKLPKGAYGTSKQSVVLVGYDGEVTFVEKTLYEDGAPVSDGPESIRRFHFKVK